MLVGSTSVLLTKTLSEDEESGLLRNSDSTKEVKSGNWRDWSCSDELLDDEVEDEEVGNAGAVMFVTICRLTCRGK